jgi:3-deoxy-D-arabino-heptulosonate 7-phosphate (DAHP) synthase
MVEVHPNPDAALSDAEQQLDLGQFARLMATLIPIHEQVRAVDHAKVLDGHAGNGHG